MGFEPPPRHKHLILTIMTLKEFCKNTGLTMEQATGKAEIKGSLYLSSVTSIPEGFNPTVGGSLDLSSVTSIPEGFNPTVGGYLDLRSVTSIPEGFNPTVGGYLDLSSVTSIPEGFNPTVGGSLDLRSVPSIPEGFNPTVGGYLYLSSERRYIGKDVKLPYVPSRYLWRNKEYINVDGIFTKIISERGNVMRVQRIACKEIEYLVTDGDGRWAHGATLKEAKDSLIYKITSRDTTKYKSWSLDTEITHAEAIEAYRVITGACAMGTRHFCETILGDKKKDTYTVAEVIELTKGQYGAENFEAFFKK